MNRTVKIIMAVVGALIVLAGGFYGGTVYGKQQAQASLPQGFRDRMTQFTPGDELPGAAVQRQFGQAGGGQIAALGGGLMGQIEEIDGNSLLVTGFDGQKTSVQATDTTLIEKYASVTVADLQIGEEVVVSGSENEDGSITARSIQVAPAGRFAPGGAPSTQSEQ
jgi:hypothetical protein